MTEKPKITTSNGYEIENPVDKLTANQFREVMSDEFGINGDNPKARMEQFKNLSIEGVAILLERINKGLQGSEDSLMNHDRAMKIGDTETIKPEDRYDVFLDLVQSVKESPDDIKPEQIADVLALGVVLLHPFYDGNGRTARAIGLLFRDEYDSDEHQADFDTIAEPRDEARKRGGFVIFGYTPHFPDGFNQSDPEQVIGYLTDLLNNENPDAFESPFKYS